MGFLITILLILILLMVFFRFVPIGLWISALAAGVKVGLFNLIGMAFKTGTAAKNCVAAD